MRYLKRGIILYIGEDSGGYPLLLVCVQRSWRELVGLAGICLEKLMGLVRLAGICLEKLMDPVRLVGILKNRSGWLVGWRADGLVSWWA